MGSFLCCLRYPEDGSAAPPICCFCLPWPFAYHGVESFLPRAMLLVTEVIHGSLLIVEGFLLQRAPLQDKWIQWILSAPLQDLCLTMILDSALRWCNTQ
nr:unnamed protein product [Digitaria exilis]